MTTSIQTTQQSSLTPFEPANMEQALTLASTLAKSGLIPEALRNKPADVLVVLLTGRELSLSPMQALRGIAVINGKPVLGADLMVAQCLRHRDVCLYFRLAESSDTGATYQTQRAGSEPVSLTWTMAQAVAAGLAGKNTWKFHPAAMLRARCASALARAVYPDLVGGMYDVDESEEMKPRAPAEVQVQQPRTESAPRKLSEVIDAVKAKAPEPEPPPEQEEQKAEPARTLDSVWTKFTEAFGEESKTEWTLAWQRAGLPNVKAKELNAEQLEALEAAMFLGEHP